MSTSVLYCIVRSHIVRIEFNQFHSGRITKFLIMDDLLVAQFVSITGADISEAPRWLEIGGGDLQAAVDFYLATGTDRRGGEVVRDVYTTAPLHAVMNTIGAKRSSMNDGDGDYNATMAAVAAADAAGNIRTSSYFGDGLSSSGDWVRRPDEVKRQRLINVGVDRSYFGMFDAVTILDSLLLVAPL